MARRPKLPEAVASKVLLESRRRCAICFGLHRDLGIKSGQLAHLDHDPTNNTESNIVFLCLEHHDDYDRPASQSRRLQASEVIEFRSELLSALTVSRTTDPIVLLARGLRLSRAEQTALRSDLMEQEAPDELRESLVRHAGLVASDTDGSCHRIHHDGRLLVSTVAYTHFPSGLIAEQNAIRSELETHSDQTVASVADGGFHRAVYEEAAHRNKIICVFPFFLTPSRRRSWGVLPFGWQTSVAIVLHRNHPAAIEWADNEVVASRIAMEPMAYPSASGTLEWLERLILHTESLDGITIWVQGYVQFEILLEGCAASR